MSLRAVPTTISTLLISLSADMPGRQTAYRIPISAEHTSTQTLSAI